MGHTYKPFNNMKFKNLFYISVFVLMVFSSCKNDDNEPMIITPEPRAIDTSLTLLTGYRDLNFEECKVIWDSIKLTSDDSYMYQTTYHGNLSGIDGITETKIEAGVITKYSNEGYSTGEKTLVSSFYETYEDIGTHGYTPRTIDELYHLCKTEYIPNAEPIQYTIQDDSTYVITFTPDTVLSFQVSEQGIIKKCGYTVEGCSDDCFRGFTISAFETID